MLSDKNGNRIRRIETLADGTFYFGLKCGKTYNILGEKNNYHEQELVLDVNNSNGYENMMTLELDEKEIIEVSGKEMLNIKTINFELNESTLMDDSKDDLAKVVRLMDKFPNMTIEFGAHTDSRGGDGYNLHLTRSRAHVTVNYLISIGANPKHIVGKGYGETELLNACSNNVDCTEIEHQQNRRTEFVIIKK